MIAINDQPVLKDNVGQSGAELGVPAILYLKLNPA